MILFVFNGKHSARRRGGRNPRGESGSQLLLKSFGPQPPIITPHPIFFGNRLPAWMVAVERGGLPMPQLRHPSKGGPNGDLTRESQTGLLSLLLVRLLSTGKQDPPGALSQGEDGTPGAGHSPSARLNSGTCRSISQQSTAARLPCSSKTNNRGREKPSTSSQLSGTHPSVAWVGPSVVLILHDPLLLRWP